MVLHGMKTYLKHKDSIEWKNMTILEWLIEVKKMNLMHLLMLLTRIEPTDTHSMGEDAARPISISKMCSSGFEH